jgi:predicted transcriptional regulator
MATSVKLDDDLKHRIQQLADTRQRSAHWIMRQAIRDYGVKANKGTKSVIGIIANSSMSNGLSKRTCSQF